MTMTWEDGGDPVKPEWYAKQRERKQALYERLWGDEPLTQKEKDLILLELMELEISPYSKWWRWGYRAVLRRTRKAYAKENL